MTKKLVHSCFRKAIIMLCLAGASAMAQDMTAFSRSVGTQMGRARTVPPPPVPSNRWPRTFYFTLERPQGLPAYLLAVTATEWETSPNALYSFDGRGRDLHDDDVPYVYAHYSTGLFSSGEVFISPAKLDSAQAKRPLDAVYPWTFVSEGQTFDKVERLDLAMCRPDTAPSKTTCVFNTVHRTSYQVFNENGEEVKRFVDDYAPQGITTGYELTLRNLKPTLRSIDVADAKIILKRGQETIAAKDESRKRAVADEYKRAVATIGRMKPGTQVFCNSGQANSLRQGRPLTAIPYLCEQLGEQYFQLEELGKYGLRVTNENRTPIAGSGIGESSVSLILEKK